MDKTKVSNFFKTVQLSLSKHGPEILTGFGIAGMITTTILAVKATPKALSLIEGEKKRQNQEIQKEAYKNGNESCEEITRLKPVDVVKTTWKCYIPAAITCAVSTACLIGASSVNARRNAVLATAYKLSESALAEYKDKVVETIGEKKEEAIRNKVHKEQIEKNPVVKNEVIITEKGKTRCYDHLSGRYFNSDIDAIKKAVNILNERMLRENYVSLNEFYDCLDLDPTGLGDILGWNLDMKLIELDFSSQICKDGTPCIVIDFKIPPKYEYDRFF